MGKNNLPAPLETSKTERCVCLYAFVGLLGLAQTSKAEPAQPRSGRAKPTDVYDNMFALVYISIYLFIYLSIYLFIYLSSLVCRPDQLIRTLPN